MNDLFKETKTQDNVTDLHIGIILGVGSMYIGAILIVGYVLTKLI
jgi:hypothetical protein